MISNPESDLPPTFTSVKADRVATRARTDDCCRGRPGRDATPRPALRGRCRTMQSSRFPHSTEPGKHENKLQRLLRQRPKSVLPVERRSFIVLGVRSEERRVGKEC